MYIHCQHIISVLLNMNKKQYAVLIIVALWGGLMGGVISTYLAGGRPAVAESSTLKPLKSIGAEKFVVTDPEGNIRAVLGLINEEPALMMFGRKDSLPRLMIFDSRSEMSKIKRKKSNFSPLTFHLKYMV